MAETPTLATVFTEAMIEALERVHTALPGCVVRYDAAAQLADVQLQVKDPDGASYPVLPGIPVAFTRAGSAFSSFPIEAGHFVFVLFAEASIDQWRAKGAETDPGDPRRHHLTSAIALPCVYPDARALADAHAENMVWGFDGGVQVHAKPSGQLALGSENPTSGVALGVPLDEFISKLYTLFTTGWVVAPNDGGLALKTAFASAFPSPPASVTSTVVKSD